MADLIGDGMTKVSWLTTIADITAPTATELNAGKHWTERITPDGLNISPTTAAVDTGSLASRDDLSAPGRRNYDGMSITFKRGEISETGTDDEPYETLKYGTSGYFVVRRGQPYEDAYATGDLVKIYPVKTGEPQDQASAANTVEKFVAPLFLRAPAATDVAVVAGA
ncbi:hypothetical protein [Streptomyces sp. UH6]|uniref:phage tail tube protein n=1 Tax=Streptomyces sp. UH6 TaxID=2748379 RepID=UPI0015D4C4D7|nr:hypothetical protein [Streptomyces sp. UH6]NYV73182.1 hypothetical protein [Streptomyces sp. UH6]